MQIREVLVRGWRGRCPRCGEGPLFIRGLKTYESCSACGLRYHDRGDTWMFMIITDRIPMLFGIAAIYFGILATNWMISTAVLVALIAPFALTLRHRQGLAYALDYLSHEYLPG